MKLYGVTSVHNEELMVPIVMPYLERMGYDRLVVWDNGSTDRTAEMLSAYPFIEIRRYETERFDEQQKLSKIVETLTEFGSLPKDSEDEQVWVTMCDFDEVYSLNLPKNSFVTMKDYLYWLGNSNNLVVREHFWCLMESGNRVYYGEPLYWNKPNMFRLDGIDGYLITDGQHDMKCTYWGGAEPGVLHDSKMISAYHLKYYSREIFCRRQRERYARDYTENHSYSDDTALNIAEYDERLSYSIPFEDYFKDKMLRGNEYVGNFWI